MKNVSRKILAVVVISLILVVFTLAQWKPVSPFAVLMAQHQFPEMEDINKPPTLVRRKVNGIPIAIPSNYLFLPIEHVGQNIWAPPPEPKPQYDENSEVTSFSIRVRLPDLVPKNPQTITDYMESFHRLDDKWIVVGVEPFNLSKANPKHWRN